MDCFKAGVMLAAVSVVMSCSESRDYAGWMAGLPDDRLVAHVSIPGSHDTATGEGWMDSSVATGAGEYSQAQELTLGEQLRAGVRGLDFRPEFKGSYLNCNHGPHESTLTFDAAIDTLCAFLEAHPSEFLVLHLFRGNVVSPDDYEAYQALMSGVLRRPHVLKRLADFRPDITVGDMRGRMLVLRRDRLGFCRLPAGGYLENWRETPQWADNPSYIMSATDSTVRAPLLTQDVSNTSCPGALDAKKRAMGDLLEFSSDSLPSLSGTPVWVMNFASGYTLTDGIYKNQNGRSDGYRDNAAECNAELLGLLKRYKGPAGIVLADYVGCDTTVSHDRPGEVYATRGGELLRGIIEHNFR